MYLVSVNSFQKLARLILKINPNQAFCRENVTVTSEKCMVDPWIIRYPCMEVKNLLFFLCVYSFWQLTLRCIQNCFDCCYRWLGSGSTRRKGETSFIVNTAVLVHEKTKYFPRAFNFSSPVLSSLGAAESVQNKYNIYRER